MEFIGNTPVIPSGHSLGVSGDTSKKLDQLRGIMRTQINIVKGVWGRHGNWISPPYLYFDMNAGMGEYIWEEEPEKILKGSPIIFLEEARRADLHYWAALFEGNPESCDLLSGFLDREYYSSASMNNSVRVHCGDNESIFKDNYLGWGKQKLGMVYMDPNGIPNFKLAKLISSMSKYKRLDIVMYCNANAIKRDSKANGSLSLAERLNLIDKKEWIVREPESGWQWTFLIGSNWIDFPSWESQGFYSVRSDKGKEVFKVLNFTTAERKNMNQPSFPLLQSLPTETMQNT